MRMDASVAAPVRVSSGPRTATACDERTIKPISLGMKCLECDWEQGADETEENAA